MTRQFFLTRALAGLCALVCGAALGQTPAVSTMASDRERLLAHFEIVDASRLKAVYLRCARESSQRLLDFDEATRCVIAGDVLNARLFGGDFNALLGWWRLHRDGRIEESALSTAPITVNECGC
jgi:hypothetical protein